MYSFGVVLLELLTGRKSVDKSRPSREQNLVQWARPMLNDPRKLDRIMDLRLEGQYSEAGAQRAAALAYQCLSFRPKQRPTMRLVVDVLEPLKDFNDVPVTFFVYTVSTTKVDDNKRKENRTRKETDYHNHDPARRRQRNRQDHEHDCRRRRRMNGQRSP